MEDEMKRFACAAAILAALAAAGFAEGARSETSLEIQADYGFPNHEAVDASGLVPIAYGVSAGAGAGQRDVGSAIGYPEAKAMLSRSFAFPLLAGEGALTRGNNLALDFSGELSPVSLNANFKATLTPIAFLKLAAGLGVGTGWDIGFVGLGINDPVSGIEARSFDGIVYRAWASGTFQFDLAAVAPGDWNHVVVLASPRVEYKAYSKASADQAWIWEADKGMNFNGLKLTGNYLLGYQMPIALDLAGILLQTEGWLGSVRDRAPSDGSRPLKWGSDFTYLVFGPLLDFNLGAGGSLAVLPQFKTGIKWTDSTARLSYFEDRDYEGSYFYFYRIAFDYTLKL
jgi:hypothetical protein